MKAQWLPMRALQCSICFLATAIAIRGIGQEKPGDKEPPSKSDIKTDWRDALRSDLEKRISLKFDNVPLNEVIDQLKQQHKLKLALDTKNLMDGGVDVTELKVQIDVRDVSVRSALDRVLVEFGLTTLAQDEVLLITTRDVAEGRTEPRIYDVRDLIPCDRGEYEYDPLIDLIGSMIAPHTWEGTGPLPIDTMYGCLIIEQSDAVHAEITALLDLLRKVKQQQARGQIRDDARLPPKSAKLEELLQRKTSVTFQLTPLKEAVEELQKRTGIDFDFDYVLYDSGLDPLQLPVSVDVSDISVRSTLNLMCRSVGLSWFAKGDTVVISTAESECGQFIVIYPVSDLVGPHSRSDAERKLNYPIAEAHSLADTIVGSVRAASWSKHGGDGVICTFDDEYPMLVVRQMEEVHQAIKDLLARLRDVRHTQAAELAQQAAAPAKQEVPALCVYRLKTSGPDEPTMSPSEIIDAVVALATRASWNQEGVYIQGAPGRLIVRQTPQVHREVLDLLRELDVLAGGGLKLPRSSSGD